MEEEPSPLEAAETMFAKMPAATPATASTATAAPSPPTPARPQSLELSQRDRTSMERNNNVDLHSANSKCLR
ncbi:hypothetical protein Y032_0055g2607 [Ancylostoma ceylanicum]|uniref:Uncharacterized protein n=1 Tax=Ancylostoma ceylanicum TaxID=53326 RepID=A0A016U6U9_9BILA|nr:hypothetical protein Y032_0055g2607 [Ancylostoma ceylanicum]